VKAAVILSRLKHLPFKISWQSKQLVKALVILVLFFGMGKSFAGDWATHEASLRNTAIRIGSMQDDLKALIVKKNKNKDPVERDKLLDEIKKKDEELKRLYENFRAEKEHVIYEHPEQGDDTERKYKHVKLKSLEEMEGESGVDGQLNRLKAKVERTYATPNPVGQK
jgi:hypothetical protein